ncbi:unannotated protein [freshwater metagenome]|uniref:Unannotated protein n=1 Tax=freshwater metagenome TaxID=449393 RepID=A0A6J7AUE4_9ZZZZ
MPSVLDELLLFARLGQSAQHAVESRGEASGLVVALAGDLVTELPGAADQLDGRGELNERSRDSQRNPQTDRGGHRTHRDGEGEVADA